MQLKKNKQFDIHTDINQSPKNTKKKNKGNVKNKSLSIRICS